MVRAMVEQGNPNSVTDAGVGALCARAAVYAAWLNVKVNASGITDKPKAAALLAWCETQCAEADRLEREIMALVEGKIGS